MPPHFFKARRVLALLFFTLNVLEPSITFGAVQEAPPDSQWESIQRTVARGDLPRALKQISRYTKHHKRNDAAYRMAGRIARKIHDPDMGIPILDQGIRQFPSDESLVRLKAELLMEKGDFSKSGKILRKLYQSRTLSAKEKSMVHEDLTVLKTLVLSIPTFSTFDQNINFQENIPDPFQNPSIYEKENKVYHIRIQNVDVGYSGGSSISTGVAVETPLMYDDLHFQAGTNLYFGMAGNQTSSPESYLFAGVDGQGFESVRYLLDAGNVFAGNRLNPGLYGHVEFPAGPLRFDGQGWYQMPWSGYGQAILEGGLQSGFLANLSAAIGKTLSLSAEYEYAFDTLQGNLDPFGINHNTMFAIDWNFLKEPNLHLLGGYDTQTFTPLVPNPTAQVPVLISSSFGFAGLSALEQIGSAAVLNGQIGGIVGTFDSPGPLVGFQADGGVSLQITYHVSLSANISYESLAEGYVGAVTTMTYGINIWL